MDSHSNCISKLKYISCFKTCFSPHMKSHHSYLYPEIILSSNQHFQFKELKPTTTTTGSWVSPVATLLCIYIISIMGHLFSTYQIQLNQFSFLTCLTPWFKLFLALIFKGLNPHPLCSIVLPEAKSSCCP